MFVQNLSMKNDTSIEKFYHLLELSLIVYKKIEVLLCLKLILDIKF